MNYGTWEFDPSLYQSVAQVPLVSVSPGVGIAWFFLSQGGRPRMANLLTGGRGMTSGWTSPHSSGATLTTSAASDPDGTTMAAKLTEGSSGTPSPNFWDTNQDVTVTTAKPYTLSVKCHTGSSGSSARNLVIQQGNFAWGNSAYGIFNPANGAVLASGVVGGATLTTTPGTLALSGGWYEFWISPTFPSSDGSSPLHCDFGLGNSSVISGDFYTGNSTSHLLLYDPGLVPGLSPIEGLTITSQTSNYTTLASDNGTVVEMNSSVAQTFTCNQPAGFNCLVVQKGVGQVTFAAGSPNTGIVSQNTKTATSGQYAEVSLYVDNGNKVQLGGNLA